MSKSIFTASFFNAYLKWFIKILQYTGSLFGAIIFNSLMILLIYKSRDKNIYWGDNIRKAPYYYVATYDRSIHGGLEKEARKNIDYVYDLQDSNEGDGNITEAYYNIRNYSWPYNNVNYDNYVSYFVTPILFGFWSYRHILRKSLQAIYPGYPQNLLGDLYRNFINKIMLTLGPIFLILLSIFIIFPYSMAFSIYAVFAEQWPDFTKYPNPFWFDITEISNPLWRAVLYMFQALVGMAGAFCFFLCWLSGIQISLWSWYVLPLWGLTNGSFLRELLPILKYNQEFILFLIVLMVYFAATSTLVDYPNVVNGIGLVVLVTILIMMVKMFIKVAGCFAGASGFGGLVNVNSRSYKC